MKTNPFRHRMKFPLHASPRTQVDSINSPAWYAAILFTSFGDRLVLSSINVQHPTGSKHTSLQSPNMMITLNTPNNIQRLRQFLSCVFGSASSLSCVRALVCVWCVRPWTVLFKKTQSDFCHHIGPVFFSHLSIVQSFNRINRKNNFAFVHLNFGYSVRWFFVFVFVFIFILAIFSISTKLTKFHRRMPKSWLN